ncbi:MAG: polyprenol monophosphomannose synthase [Euryarchaeota archaeon]|nr:polyprenol monophosphomannose synthase [Euryarchaeota archaeon]
MGGTARTVIFSLTYNERDNVPGLVRRVSALALPDTKLVIVDDNSPDGTGQVAEELAREFPDFLHVFHREKKEGYGPAYAFAVKQILARFAPDFIVSMDADLSHRPEDIPSIVQALDGGSDFVIGSRYVPGGSVVNWPVSRRLVSRVANRLARLMARNGSVRDNTSGFRGFTAGVARSLDWAAISTRGYGYLTTCLTAVIRFGLVVREVPIQFRDRENGKSKMNMKTVVGFFANLIRIRMAPRRAHWLRVKA